MDKKKNFIHINEAFTCQNCGTEVEKHPSSCRNHCPKCLYSLHVDEKTPGDRSSKCIGLMEPIAIEQDKKKGFVICHKCKKCGKEIRNKTSEDDNLDKIIVTMQLAHAKRDRKKS